VLLKYCCLQLDRNGYVAFRKELDRLKKEQNFTDTVDLDKLDVVMQSNIIDYLHRVPFLKQVEGIDTFRFPS